MIKNDLHIVKWLKMSRPSFEEIYMRFAEDISERSTCKRRSVGCCITTTDYKRVLSVGYNGNASGLKNGCDKHEAQGNCGCLHAEENAIINCSAGPHIDKIVFSTVLPCIMCAKRIINLGGVKKVIFKHDYRKHDSMYIFEKVGIELYQTTKSGILLRCYTNDKK